MLGFWFNGHALVCMRWQLWRANHHQFWFYLCQTIRVYAHLFSMVTLTAVDGDAVTVTAVQIFDRSPVDNVVGIKYISLVIAIMLKRVKNFFTTEKFRKKLFKQYCLVFELVYHDIISLSFRFFVLVFFAVFFVCVQTSIMFGPFSE